MEVAFDGMLDIAGVPLPVDVVAACLLQLRRWGAAYHTAAWVFELVEDILLDLPPDRAAPYVAGLAGRWVFPTARGVVIDPALLAVIHALQQRNDLYRVLRQQLLDGRVSRAGWGW